jgi:hypothetical protein
MDNIKVDDLKVDNIKVGDLYYSKWSAGDEYINRIVSINEDEVEYQGVKCIIPLRNENLNTEPLWTSINDFLSCSVPLTDDLKVKFL